MARNKRPRKKRRPRTEDDRARIRARKTARKAEERTDFGTNIDIGPRTGHTARIQHPAGGRKVHPRTILGAMLMLIGGDLCRPRL